MNGLHDPLRCDTCLQVRVAVEVGEMSCSHAPDAVTCEMCLLGLMPELDAEIRRMALNLVMAPKAPVS